MEAEGSAGVALMAAIVLFGGLLVERALTRLRVRPYYTWGLGLDPAPVPIPAAPEGAGETTSVRWEVVDDLVLFSASRGSPMFLHGSVRLVRDRDRVHLVVRWSPPWSLLLAAAWLAGIGASRGDGGLAGAVAAALVVAVTILYRQAVVRAVAELRWAFVREDRT